MNENLLPTIDTSVGKRKLGCLPTSPIFKATLRHLAEVVDILPRSQWGEVDYAHLVRRVFDQDGIGSCASESTVQAVEIARCIAGNDDSHLSPGNLYGRVNGGRDAGSTLGDNLSEIEQAGVCTEATVSHLDWRNWDAPGWRAEAKRYRATEIYLCPSFDAMATAVLRGCCVVFGIMVGNNFNPGPDGWLPEYTGGMGGHAMIAVGLAKKSGRWGLRVVNSWSDRWGVHGFCVVPESYFATYWEDGFGIRVVIDPSDDGDLAL